MAIDQPTTASDTFGNFLKKISKYRILSDSEVISLCKDIRAYSELEDKLTTNTLAELGITQLDLEQVKAKSIKSKQKLITHNIRFVAHIAKRYQAYGLTMEDLVQEGTIGLNRAAELFKPERGYKFTTYAFWWIRQSITKALNLNGKCVKMPPDVQTILKDIKRAKQRLHKQNGYEPSIAEIAAVLNKSQNRIYQVLNCTKEFMPINERGFDLLDNPEPSFINVRGVTPDIVSELPKLQQYIIIRKFGLDGKEAMSYKDIAASLDCSLPKVLKEKALAFDKLVELCS